MKLAALFAVAVLFLAGPAEYRRNEWRTWMDYDNDCRDTRQEVLIRDAVEGPIMDKDGCKVVSGVWQDAYTGKYYTDPSELDVDHVVPLYEAHMSGGERWHHEYKRLYANYMGFRWHLVLTHKSINRSKGSKDPSEWLPEAFPYQCGYVAAWIAIKKQWKMTADEKELAALKRVGSACEAAYGSKAKGGVRDRLGVS